MFNWLKRHKKQEIKSQQSADTQPAAKAVQINDQVISQAKRELENLKPANLPAQEQLNKLHQKLDALAERFAGGNINRVQFQELFSFYQGKVHDLESILALDPESEDWKKTVNDGQSLIIRRKFAAKLNGFSIVDHRNGMPLRTIGDFGLDPALFVPMLYAYQSATKEIFGGSARLTQIEGGKWLVFISGRVTTTIALFSTEPSQQQLKSLGEVHRVFESANINRLEQKPVDSHSLVCPHEYFLTHTL
jgi:hypothetical protein